MRIAYTVVVHPGEQFSGELEAKWPVVEMVCRRYPLEGGHSCIAEATLWTFSTDEGNCQACIPVPKLDEVFGDRLPWDVRIAMCNPGLIDDRSLRPVYGDHPDHQPLIDTPLENLSKSSCDRKPKHKTKIVEASPEEVERMRRRLEGRTFITIRPDGADRPGSTES